MNFKLYLFLNYIKKVSRSPSRMVLTLSGLVLSVVILLSGLIFAETYLSFKISKIEPYKKNKAIVIEGKTDFEYYKELSNNKFEKVSIELVSNYLYNVAKYKYNNQEISILIRDIRVNELNTRFLSQDVSSDLRYEAKLLYGRTIKKDDIEKVSRVAVIEEELSMLLFGEKNSVGKKIKFPVYKVDEVEKITVLDYYEQLEVIGVVSSSEETIKSTSILKNDNISSDTSEIQMFVYTPLSLELANKKIDENKMRVLCFSKISNYKNNIEKINKNTKDNYNTSDYYSLLSDINYEISDIKRGIFYLVIFTFFISGLCILNTMFFSIKERVNEIGIRKSIGAYNEDIILQFIFEGLLYGIVSSVIGVIISSVGASCIYILINGYKRWNTYLVISQNSIILSILISILIGIIASILPAIYASKIKINDAIKYD